MSKKKDLTTLRLFSPLSANWYSNDEFCDSSNWPEHISPVELCAHEDAILERIAQERSEEEGERGLAFYLDDAALKEKVYSMNPTVEVWQGELWGVLEVQSYGELTDTERKAITDEWCGQASDGWGEGFEQRPIKTEDGELYVSFWNTDNFFIRPEQELKEPMNHDITMQMGGM